MKTWIKRLLCRHEWERKRDIIKIEGHYIRPVARYVCRKCGKELCKG